MEHGLPEGVVAVIRRSDGAYLFIQRAAHNSFGGYWCPVSGRLELRIDVESDGEQVRVFCE